LEGLSHLEIQVLSYFLYVGLRLLTVDKCTNRIQRKQRCLIIYSVLINKRNVIYNYLIVQGVQE